MIIDALKLALAGLMVMFDFLGIANSNHLILNMAKKIDIEDAYQIQPMLQSSEEKILLPELQLAKSAPYLIDPLSYPLIEASSAVVIDVETKGIMFEKNMNEPRAMASVTKLMTAIVALESVDMNQAVTITAADTYVEPIVMGLLPGEQIYGIDILKGLLIKSGNDAAMTLARVGGGGSVDKFIEMMNQKAKKLGLKNTNFANPHGLDQDNHYSSAKDLALLAAYAMQDEKIADAVGTMQETVSSSDGNISHYLKNTNELLDSYLKIEGVKTGFTDHAGQVLITQSNKDGHRIVSVVMNSPDRFQESKILIDWAFGNYYWE